MDLNNVSFNKSMCPKESCVQTLCKNNRYTVLRLSMVLVQVSTGILHMYGYCMCTCVGTQNTAWGWRLGEVNRVGCLRRQEDLSPYFVMVEENRRMKRRVNRLDKVKASWIG